MASSVALNTTPIVTVDAVLTTGHRPEVIVANELGIPGGPVTIEDGGDVATGATTDSAATAGGTGTVSAKLRKVTGQLDTLATSIGATNAAAEDDPSQTASVVALLKGILTLLTTANGLLNDIKTNTAG